MLKANLAKLRKKAGISQEQLASELGVSRQAVSKYELGTAEPDLTRLEMLKDFFGVSYDELLGEGIQTGKPIMASNGRVVIQSKVNDHVQSFRSFWISKTVGINHKRAPLQLIGNGGFLGLDIVTLGYYTTKENANKELAMIQAAIGRGEATYQLRYNVKTFKGGFLGLSARIAQEGKEKGER